MPASPPARARSRIYRCAPSRARRLLVLDGLGGASEPFILARALTMFGPDEAEPEDAPGTGSFPAHATIMRDLATAAVRGADRVVHSSNAVFLLELEGADPFDAARSLRAIYKPVRGERPLWDFPGGTLHLREAAAYVVDAALGFDVIPPTVLRDGPYGAGSLQLFVDVVEREPTATELQALQPALTTLAALDVLINNADRKSAHLLVTGRGLRAIDNALSFLPYPRQRTVLIQLGGSDIPPETATTIAELAAHTGRREALLTRLRLLLAEDEVIAFAARLDRLAARPVYPELDPWEGRPFEMW